VEFPEWMIQLLPQNLEKRVFQEKILRGTKVLNISGSAEGERTSADVGKSEKKKRMIIKERREITISLLAKKATKKNPITAV